jgi:hypothetical protein
MNNTQLRDSLIYQADAAFLRLADQVDALLDAANFFVQRYPDAPRHKTDDLNMAVADMAQLLRLLSHEVEAWKRGTDRVVSKFGVETEILNELRVTMEVSMLFFIREEIELPRFNLANMEKAHVELVRCNRLL